MEYAVAQQLQTWAHRRPEFLSLWSEGEIPALGVETFLMANGKTLRECSFRWPHLLCVEWGDGGKLASHKVPSGACLR